MRGFVCKEAKDNSEDNETGKKKAVKYEIKPIKYDDLLSKCRGYIRELARMPNCINVHGNQTSCTCIHYLRDKEDELIDMIS